MNLARFHLEIHPGQCLGVPERFHEMTNVDHEVGAVR
jgi:hypothetical protein